MKMAAAVALARLAKEPIPDYVKAAYNDQNLEYGKYHIIPKPFNKEVLIWVASAVANAAIEDGVSDMKDFNINEYQKVLKATAYKEDLEK
jgi:malate dehydrogenase (oxaloacetate-decarboxylating)(NADP+)